MKANLDPIGLWLASYLGAARTHASLGHEAGIDPKVAADQRGHGIGVALTLHQRLSARAPKGGGGTARKQRLRG